ncbi:DUF2207 family protein [Eubacterium oxidoreducens]|uniref:Predicted membrane protein n=1 Tax=Eubacterium oxidoreducens TaxID=1732 RepID=A0A1G6BCB8_EUBOX|nr:DUF2207 domain-containing protein [Eubacterium oxidoreducens]SDB18250.1 Predicted membrane protein [Eubacterium oxidoreducens]
MRKIYKMMIAVFAFFILVGIGQTQAKAANHVSDMDIDVTIHDDGSITVVQVWTGDFSDTDTTENYIPMVDGGVLELESFSVSENGQEYINIGDWDIDADFDEKAGKCGVNDTDDGFELCWGITEYGTHSYEVTYTMANAVMEFGDCVGTNYRFVNSGMSTTPTAVDLKISLENKTAITDEIADIWGFGYDGMIEFEDGCIHAYTESDIDEDGYMTILFSLEEGTITPTYTSDKTFDEVEETAKEGSDYGAGEMDDDFGVDDVLSFGAFFIYFGIIILVAIVGFVKRQINLRQREKLVKSIKQEAGYYRELPNEGNLEATYYLGESAGIIKEGDIIGARMLKLVMDGCLEVVEDTTSRRVLRGKNVKALKLVHEPKDDPLGLKLYNIIKVAAGSDAILQEKELPTYSKKNSSRIRKYITNCSSKGMQYALDKQLSIRKNFKAKQITQKDREELGQILGFKNYLEEFSLISEREMQEVSIWQEYLVFAYLLGIAQEVVKELKKHYPQFISEIEYYDASISCVYFYHCHTYSALAAAEAAERAAANAGSGGHASFGGGGGSFGGGGGGGSR